MNYEKNFIKQDYLDFLYRELDGLIDLCYLYDHYEKFERASNMATVLRVLLYDTGSSTSILKHLDVKSSIGFLNSSIPSHEDAEFTISMLIATLYTKDETIESIKPIAVPKCYGKKDFEGHQLFDDWWNHALLKFEGKTFTRGDIITTTAHKFGAAHADRKVDALYYDLANGLPSMLFYSNESNEDSEKIPIDNMIFAIIRQISHEVISTLLNFYQFDLEYEVLMNGSHYTDDYTILEDSKTLEEILEFEPDYINKDDMYK